MPLFPGHPPFQVLTYRSPQGIRVSGAEPWGPGNDAGLGYMCEYVLSTSHSGAHIDALAHMTIGEDDHWFCGAARTHLGDFGQPLATPPPSRRFGHVACCLMCRAIGASNLLGRSEPVSADELKAIAKGANVELGQGDVALVRTGYLSHWPDTSNLEAHRGAGPDLSAADGSLSAGLLHVDRTLRRSKSNQRLHRTGDAQQSATRAYAASDREGHLHHGKCLSGRARARRCL